MNLLGIDFEDWFHPELIQKILTNEEKKPKVIQGIDKIIEWLNHHDTYATFFCCWGIIRISTRNFR